MFLYVSWLKQIPARYQLEALSACKLIQMPLSVLDDTSLQSVQLGLLKQQLLYKEQKEAFYCCTHLSNVICIYANIHHFGLSG